MECDSSCFFGQSGHQKSTYDISSIGDYKSSYYRCETTKLIFSCNSICNDRRGQILLGGAMKKEQLDGVFGVNRFFFIWGGNRDRYTLTIYDYNYLLILTHIWLIFFMVHVGKLNIPYMEPIVIESYACKIHNYICLGDSTCLSVTVNILAASCKECLIGPTRIQWGPYLEDHRS